MSIYDFTPAELEEIRRADERMTRPRRPHNDLHSPNWGGDRRSPTAKAKHINHLGNPLWEYRVMRGLTQRDLAEEMHISQQCISDLERGRLPISKYVRCWLQERGVAV